MFTKGLPQGGHCHALTYSRLSPRTGQFRDIATNRAKAQQCRLKETLCSELKLALRSPQTRCIRTPMRTLNCLSSKSKGKGSYDCLFSSDKSHAERIGDRCCSAEVGLKLLPKTVTPLQPCRIVPGERDLALACRSNEQLQGHLQRCSRCFHHKRSTSFCASKLREIHPLRGSL